MIYLTSAPIWGEQVENFPHSLFIVQAFAKNLVPSSFKLYCFKYWHYFTFFPININIKIMGEYENLADEAAIEKIKEMVDDTKMCMFNSSLNLVPCNTRPMAIQQVEDDGTIWFFSDADSEKNKEIEDDNRVQLLLMNNSSSAYLSLYGTASIITDAEKSKELWNVFLKTWFNDGPEDPNLSLIKFTPQNGHYWDTKNSKIVSMFKIAMGAILGKELDAGVEGKMTV